jgi:RNA polymerase sigma-70 factor (ECF subfamily)
MSETSPSLLDAARRDPHGEAWGRLLDVYAPLIRGWLKRTAPDSQDSDIDDIVQEVLAVLVRKLPEFRREPRPGAFRRWLRSITVNCLRDFWRAQRLRPRAKGGSDFAALLEQLEDPESGLSRQWDQEHDDHVVRQLLALIRPHFQAGTWQAFVRVAVDGVAAEQVAAELGISVNAVFIAKSRVLTRLRQEGAGLLD